MLCYHRRKRRRGAELLAHYGLEADAPPADESAVTDVSRLAALTRSPATGQPYRERTYLRRSLR